MKVVFMGSPEFAVPSLRALIENGYSLSAVVSQPDKPRARGKKIIPTPVKQVAVANGIRVLQPQKLSSEDFVEQLKKIQPDVIVVVAFGKILTKDILDLPPLGCINVHASLLPKYRGAAPIHRSVINGEKITGVTTMFMDQGLDTGDMLLKESLIINENDTAGDLHDRLAQIGSSLLIKTLHLSKIGKIKRIPQNDKDATYAPPLTKEEQIIDWNEPSYKIRNLVRGLNPWPGARTYINQNMLKIWQCSFYIDNDMEKEYGHITPGTVLRIERNNGIVIKTGKGLLLLTELQLQDRKKMKAAEFLRGCSLSKGMVLG